MSSNQEKNSIHIPMDLVLDQTQDPWSKGLCRGAQRLSCLPMMVRMTLTCFLVPFERIAERYAWSDIEKIDRLYESLKSKAMWYVCSLPRAMTAYYRSMHESLTKRKDPLQLCAGN